MNEREVKMHIKSELESEVSTVNNRLYRICTENVNQDDIVRLIHAHGFNGATLLAGAGIWQGTQEKALVIEIVTNKAHAASIGALATAIKVHNHQEAILVQAFEVNSYLL